MPVCCPPARRSSLFLTDCGALTLRVRGSAHDGRLIRIRSPKCTVGSAAGCTLRLRADGVSALHCWVLRGSSGAVIRRMHGAATLNGGAFDEAPLNSGDRLRIGSVELEVVECAESAPPAAPQPFPPTVVPDANTAELEAKLDEVTEQVARLEGEARQGWQSSIVAAERANQLRDALAAADQQLEEAGQELQECQQTIARQSAELESLRHQRTQARVDDSGIVKELTRKLSEREAELEAVRREAAAATGAMTIAISRQDPNVAAETEKWRSRTHELEAQIETLQKELGRSKQALHDLQEEQKGAAKSQRDTAHQIATLERQLAEQLHEVQSLRQKTAEHGALQSRAEELASQVAYHARALADAQEQTDAARALVRTQQQQEEKNREREQQCREIVAREGELSRLGLEVDQQRQELEKARQQLANDRGQLERDRQEAELQRQEFEAQRENLAGQQQLVQAATEQLAALKAELEVERQQLAAAKAAPPSQVRDYLDQQSAELETRQQALDEKVADFEMRRQQFELEVRAWEARRQENGRSGEDMAAGGERDMSEPVNTANVTAPWQPVESLPLADEMHTQDAADEQPLAAGAVPPPPENVTRSSSVDSVLSRLVRAGVWRNPNEQEPEEPPASAGSMVEPPAPPEVPAYEVPRAPAAIPSTPAAAPEPASPEDDSIESYMDRLLKRVRGESTTNAGGWKQSPPVEAAPAPAPAPVEEASGASELVAAAPASVTATEYLPRTKAPEMTADLSAMRALANSAAHAAIERHSRNHKGKQAAGRLGGAVLTAAASLLLGYWAWMCHSLPAGIGASIGGAFGLYLIFGAGLRFLSVMRLGRPGADAQESEEKADE